MHLSAVVGKWNPLILNVNREGPSVKHHLVKGKLAKNILMSFLNLHILNLGTCQAEDITLHINVNKFWNSTSSHANHITQAPNIILLFGDLKMIDVCTDRKI